MAPSFLASASPSGTRRPAMTILAPSATKTSAVRRPMPLVAPVMTATLPLSRPISFPLLRSLECRCRPVLALPAYWNRYSRMAQGELIRTSCERLCCASRVLRYPRFALSRPYFGSADRAVVTHEEIDRRIPAGLAGDIAPAIAASALGLRRSVSRWRRGALGPVADPAGHFLHALHSGRVLCHRRSAALRIGIATALAGGVLGVIVNFGDGSCRFRAVRAAR